MTTTVIKKKRCSKFRNIFWGIFLVILLIINITTLGIFYLELCGFGIAIALVIYLGAYRLLKLLMQ